jgi:hypothetical protein
LGNWYGGEWFWNWVITGLVLWLWVVNGSDCGIEWWGRDIGRSRWWWRESDHGMVVTGGNWFEIGAVVMEWTNRWRWRINGMVCKNLGLFLLSQQRERKSK